MTFFFFADIDCLTCPHCKKTYSSKGNLTTHIRTIHTKIPQIFTCPYCRRQYSSKNYLRFHVMKSHTNEHDKEAAIKIAIATAKPI